MNISVFMISGEKIAKEKESVPINTPSLSLIYPALPSFGGVGGGLYISSWNNGSSDTTIIGFC